MPTRRPVVSALRFASLAAAAVLPGCRSLDIERKAPAGTEADLLLAGGTVRTLAPSLPAVVEALAVRDGRIVAAGDLASVSATCGPRTRVVDLRGGCVVPGLADAHGHVLGYGLSLRRIDLVGTTSAEEVAARVEAAARRARPGEFILGRGWDQNDWPVAAFPGRALLDRAAPRNPVVLVRVDGHAIWVNGAAFEAAGVGSATPDPPGGKILRDPRSGEPTGVLVDTATDLVESRIPPLTDAERRAALEDSLARLAAFGLTGIHDAGVGRDTLADYRRLEAEGRLPLRIYVLLADDPELLREEFARGPETSGGGLLAVRAVKLYADGALGSRGAALLEPYSDDPGNVGLLVSEPEHLEDVTTRALAAGFQACVHAIGDRGNRVALDVFERALARAGRADARLRVEHAQVVAPDDLRRFARLGVVASMQPTHCTSDMYWAADRLGPRRVLGAYAWRSLLDAGARIAAGSDFPVESPDPLLGLYAARTRQDRNGWPEAGFLPSERMTAEEALRSFTTEAAYASFRERDLGSIAPGMLADLTVLDRDPVECAPADLLDAKIRMTIVNGRVVYEAGPPD